MNDGTNNIIQLGAIKADLHAPRSREECLLECDRELGIRRRCFPDWVDNGKLSMADARNRLEVMAETCRVLATVHALTDAQWAQVQATAELNAQQN